MEIKKRLLLAMTLLLASTTLTACYIPPDAISDNTVSLTVGSDTLPFASRKPSDSGQSGWTDYTSVLAGQTGEQPTPTPEYFIHLSGDMAGEPEAEPSPETEKALVTFTPAPIATATLKPIATSEPTAEPAPTIAILQIGDSGSSVKRLQQRLKDLGYYKGSVDGEYGEGTASAVRAFQRQNNLAGDGKAGAQTQNRLYSKNAIAATPTPKPTKKPTASPTPTATPTATPKGTATPKVTATPKPTATLDPAKYRYLSVGYSGKEVTQLQTRLIALGWLSGTPDGEYGGATEAAVIAFQKKNGLWSDGKAGPETQKVLYSDEAKKATTPAAYLGDTLKDGAEGQTVRVLQTQLKALGYYTGLVDGSYGAGTAQAVSDFQQENGLKADGAAGRATQNALFSSTVAKKGQNPTAAPTTAVTTAASATATSSGSAKPQATPEIMTTGYSVLQSGVSGNEVLQLQTALQQIGLYTGTLDGSYGSGTARAVREYQSAHHLTVDGKAGPVMQRMLYGVSTRDTYETLRPGDSGRDVLNMQYALYELGYYDGPVNGNYGQTTDDAVRAFQISNELTPVDGIAGNKTLRTLYSSTAVPAGAVTVNYQTLRKGDKGNEVVELQDRLTKLGYMNGATGVYDEETVAAVKSFQKKNGLDTDGTAGPATQTVMYSNAPVRAD